MREIAFGEIDDAYASTSAYHVTARGRPGKIVDAYASTSAEQRNSPRLGRLGMNLKNKTHPHPPKYCIVPVLIPRAFSIKRVFALGSFHVEPA